MESDGISWQTIPNTVANRMIDLSLIHKLIPSRKVQRRTKAMNTAIKQFHSLKSYSKYIKMKTSILRDLSDNSETDDNASFTEDDYNNLYKSDISLKNNMMQTSTRDMSFYEAESDINENDIDHDTITEKASNQKSKHRSSRTLNLGWQEVIKKKKQSVCFSLDETYSNKFSHSIPVYSQRVDIQENMQDSLNVSNDCKSFVSCYGKGTLSQKNEVSGNNKICTAEKSLELLVKTTNSNNVTCNIITGQKVTSSNMKSAEETNFVTNKLNEVFKSEENYHSPLEDHGILKNINESLMPLLNNNLDQNHSDSSDRNKKIETNEGGKFSQMQSFHIGSTNHPKDSGIEEDTEEEFPEDRERICTKDEKKTQEACQIMQITSSMMNHENNCVVESSLTTTDDNLISSDHNTSDKMVSDNHSMSDKMVSDDNSTSDKIVFDDHSTVDEIIFDGHNMSNKVISDDYDKSDKLMFDGHDTSAKVVSDGHNVLDEMNFQNKALFSLENIDNREEEQDSIQRHRLQPKVTCTEIVSKRYRIIPSNMSLSNDNTNLELNTHYVCNEKVLNPVEPNQNMEDSMSPLSKRRLQQLRRLNLTVDSESSFSEDDNNYCDIENMRDKLLKRSEESSNLSDNENKNVKKGKNYKFKKSKKERDVYPIEIYEEYTKNKNVFNSGESVQSDESVLKFVVTNNNVSKQTPTYSSKKDLHPITNQCQSISENSSKICTCYFGNKGNSSNQYSKINNKSFEDNDKINNSSKIEIVQPLNKCPANCSRPRNIQELIKEENLAYETAESSFVFKDIHEDDIFVLDIPSMVLEKQLVGKKIVLTEKKLKLGNHKYKIALKDVDCMSCVFSTGKSHKPYKTVNIKPVTRIVARQKIYETSVSKSSSPCTSNTVSYTEGTTVVETNTASTKKRSKREHDLLFKRKRSKITE